MLQLGEGKYPNHFQEAMGLPRVDNTPAAQDIYEHGFKRPVNDLISPRLGVLGLIGIRSFRPIPEEALRIYYLGQRERYALTSVIAGRVINRALGHRASCKPYGLVGLPIDPDSWEEDTKGRLAVVVSMGAPDPFRMLDINMARTLSLAHAQEIRVLRRLAEDQPDLNAVQAYRRLRQWEDFYHRFLPLNPNRTVDLGEEAGASLNRVFTESPTGIGTAVRFDASLLRLIPQRLALDIPGREISADLLAQTAKNSLPLIIKNSKFPYDIQAVVHDILSGEIPFQRGNGLYHRGYFDPENFVTKKSSRGYRVDMKASVMERAKSYLARKRGTDQLETAGCPAGVDVDGTGSPIKKFWDWNADIGSMIYRDLWDILFKPHR